ncbi:MAG: hypothetical protein J7K64_00765 [Bacteroidales bacterium]|nr:hypothetical protein [Bacteroidales bacterium]
MDIYLKDNKLDKIWFYEKPKGKIHPPMTLSQSETILSGFKWEEQNRPLKKEDIYVRYKKETDLNDSENTEEENLQKNTEDSNQENNQKGENQSSKIQLEDKK